MQQSIKKMLTKDFMTTPLLLVIPSNWFQLLNVVHISAATFVHSSRNQCIVKTNRHKVVVVVVSIVSAYTKTAHNITIYSAICNDN